MRTLAFGLIAAAGLAAGSVPALAQIYSTYVEPRTTRIERGVGWGIEVAQAVLDWRVADGFSASYPAFVGGSAVGQWRHD